MYVKEAIIPLAGKKLANVIIIAKETKKNMVTTVLPNNVAPNRHMIKLDDVTKVV